SRWAEAVMRRPWPFLAGSVLVLLMFVIPVLRLQAWNIGAADLPLETEARRGFEMLATQFPRGWIGPIVGVIEARAGGSVWSAASRREIVELGRELAREPGNGTVLGMPQVLERMGTLAFPARVTGDL